MFELNDFLIIINHFIKLNETEIENDFINEIIISSGRI
jgi:hypothetical protein